MSRSRTKIANAVLGENFRDKSLMPIEDQFQIEFAPWILGKNPSGWNWELAEYKHRGKFEHAIFSDIKKAIKVFLRICHKDIDLRFRIVRIQQDVVMFT